MDKVAFLKSTDLFCTLTEEELKQILGELTVVTFGGGDVLFTEGDVSDSAYLVIDGQVVLSRQVNEEVEKTVFVARDGAIFGEMGILDRSPRAATATAEGEVHLIRLGSELFERILDRHPPIAAKMLTRIGRLLAERLRKTNDLYVSAVQWGLEVSGARGMNLQDIMDDYRTVDVGLRGGKVFTGQILRIESSVAGYEVTLKTDDGTVVLLPYHAIEHVNVDLDSAQFVTTEAS